MSSTKWVVDPLHSEVQFKVKHLVISTVTGFFKTFKGEAIAPSEDFANSDITFSMDVNSIDTNQHARDEHLKNSDFFDVEHYPDITFKSTSFRKVNDEQFKLVGDLTMKGVTKTIELDAAYGGTVKDFHGNTKAGFEVAGKINRREFGLTYNAITETGGLALGEDIKLLANIQLAKVA
jgi:polyisoprenoid-binding protein YceI